MVAVGRQAGSSHTGFCVHRQPPDGLRLPGDPLFSSPGLAGSSTTRGSSPEAWDGLAGCPEALPAVGLFFGPAPAVLRFPPYQPSGTY